MSALDPLAVQNAGALQAIQARGDQGANLSAVVAATVRDKSNTSKSLKKLAEAGLLRSDGTLYFLTDHGAAVVAALARAEGAPPPGGGELFIPHDLIDPDPDNARKRFDDAELEALARSISRDGRLLYPLLVRPADAQGRHQLIDGERRWRAIGRIIDAGEWPEGQGVRCLIPDEADGDPSILALIANLQRVDLNPIEEAAAFRQLHEREGWPTARIAEEAGKSQRHVQQRLQLLKLPPELQDRLARGELKVEEARHQVQHRRDPAPEPTAADLPPDSRPSRERGGSTGPAPGGDGVGGPSEEPAPTRSVAHIKLQRHEAVALAELAHRLDRVTVRAGLSIPVTPILDDGKPHTDLLKLRHEGFVDVWDTASGLLAGVLPDGYAWLAANYPAGLALPPHGLPTYRTAWLNPGAASPPPPAPPAPPETGADEGDPGMEPHAGSEPGATASPTGPEAPGSTPPAGEPHPQTPDDWARRLLDCIARGETHDAYLALASLMRISGSPETSGAALKAAWAGAFVHALHTSAKDA